VGQPGISGKPANRGKVVAVLSVFCRRTGVSKTSQMQATAPLPLVLRWKQPDNPLPLRTVQLPARARARTVGLEAPPWLHTGPTEQPFDFSGHIRRLCVDIVKHCEDLRHIDVSRLLFGMTQARNSHAHGLQARVTPLRFRHGELIRRRRGVTYQVQRYFVDDRELLYLVTFCLPRFLDQDFDDKFITLFHELYHISPQFEGDLRRHDGRYALHSHSKRQYDAHMADLARSYMNNGADRSLHGFLRMNFAQLRHRHGSVQAVWVPRPRLLPITEETH
jgi:predicted metallopeptidase